VRVLFERWHPVAATQDTTGRTGLPW